MLELTPSEEEHGQTILKKLLEFDFQGALSPVVNDLIVTNHDELMDLNLPSWQIIEEMAKISLGEIVTNSKGQEGR